LILYLTHRQTTISPSDGSRLSLPAFQRSTDLGRSAWCCTLRHATASGGMSPPPDAAPSIWLNGHVNLASSFF